MYSVQIVPPLYLLQTLVVFSEQGNLVQTAERLGLTQPTVTRQLQQLEELFDQPLFAQEGRNKVLTKYAGALVSELKPRFADLERVFQRVDQAIADPKQVTLRVAGPGSVTEKYFSEVTFDGALELQNLSDDSTQASLLEHSIDLAITKSPIERAEFSSKKLMSSVPAIAIPKKWASQIESVKDWIQVCSKHPMAVYSKDHPELLDFRKKYSSSDLQIHFVSSDWKTLENRVHEQKSWSLIPSALLQKTSAYKVFPLSNLFEAEHFYLSYRKELLRHDWMKALLEQVLAI